MLSLSKKVPRLPEALYLFPETCVSIRTITTIRVWPFGTVLHASSSQHYGVSVSSTIISRIGAKITIPYDS